MNAKCAGCGRPLQLTATPGMGPVRCWDCHPARAVKQEEDAESLSRALSRLKAKADKQLKELG